MQQPFGIQLEPVLTWGSEGCETEAHRGGVLRWRRSSRALSLGSAAASDAGALALEFLARLPAPAERRGHVVHGPPIAQGLGARRWQPAQGLGS